MSTLYKWGGVATAVSKDWESGTILFGTGGTTSFSVIASSQEEAVKVVNNLLGSLGGLAVWKCQFKSIEVILEEVEYYEEPRSGADRIAAERARQVSEEGYTPEHDSGHAIELTMAAEAYAYEAEVQILTGRAEPWGNRKPKVWPWSVEDWKPSEDPIRNLEKAGALIAAAIDSLEES